MRRALAAFVFAALAAFSASAQKMYVAEISGPVLLVRANGSLARQARTGQTLKILTPVAYGDVVATGPGGSVTLSLPGTLTVRIHESSVIGYFFTGPGTAPRPFISLIAGGADVSSPSGGAPWMQVLDDRIADASANAPRETLERGAAKLERLYADLEKLGADCENSTATLEAAAGEYRSLLAAAGDTAAADAGSGPAYRETELQTFRETQLYPAEDARSSIVKAIQYRTILARTIRTLVLPPLYAAVKTAHPAPGSWDAETAAFFDRYEAVIDRYDEVLFR